MPLYTDAVRVGDIVQQAYRLGGGLKHAGQGIAPSELAEGMLIFNWMIDSWKIEKLLFIYYKRQLCPIVAAQKDYSVGPSQDWDMERVERLGGAGYLLSPAETSEAELPMQIVQTYEQYQNFISKNISSSYPLVLYYKALVEAVPDTIPYGQATLWPIPNQNAYVAIYWPVTLNLVQNADEIIYTPKGFKEALVYNLAIKVHDRYPEAPWSGATITTEAAFGKKKIKSMQSLPLLIGSDPAALGMAQPAPWYGYPKAWTPYGTGN